MLSQRHIPSFSQAVRIDNSIVLPRRTTLAGNHNRAITTHHEIETN